MPGRFRRHSGLTTVPARSAHQGKYWYPVDRHASDAPRDAEFFVDDDLVYPMPCTNPPVDPWFVVIAGLAYPTRHHPDGESHEPWYELVGAFVYPAKGNPRANTSRSLYQARPGPS